MSTLDARLHPQLLARTDRSVRPRRLAMITMAASSAPLFALSALLLPHLGHSAGQAVTTLARPGVADRYLSAQLIEMLASLVTIAFVLIAWLPRVAAGSLLRLVAGTVVIVAMASNAVSLCLNGYLPWLGIRAGADHHALASMMDAADTSSPWLAPVSFAAVPIALLALIVLSVGVLRARVAPAWAPSLIMVGVLLAAVPVGAGATGRLLGLLLALPSVAGYSAVIWYHTRTGG